ncbi:MAG: hypothetical protein WD801_12320 [Gemmatimonadaceae bacterium]
MRSRTSALLLCLLSASTLDAQAIPDGWRWATDSASVPSARTDTLLPGTFHFVSMAPGWHVTMGPGALLFHPDSRASGRFELQSRLILFPGTAPAEYGVFVGGADLDGASRSWTAFLVRRDGSAAVLRHEQGRTRELLPWAAAPGVKPGAAANVVRVVVDTAVRFVVNDSVVATLPRAQVATAGVYGFRIGPALNLHITTLDATLRHAPVPPPKP